MTDSFTPNTLAWFEVATDDPDTATSFYTALFGWTFTPFADPDEAGVDYRVATQPEGDPPFGGVLATGGAMAPHAIFSSAVARVRWAGRDAFGPTISVMDVILRPAAFPGS